MIDLILISACSAPKVHPLTVAAIIREESSFNPLAININNAALKQTIPTDFKTEVEAETLLKDLLKNGVNFDAGLMQINSSNFESLGLTPSSVLDPCSNIKGGTTLLRRFYASALQNHKPGEEALKAALSAYNTGNHKSGFVNGYVKKYFPKTLLVNAPAPYKTNPFKAPMTAISFDQASRSDDPMRASMVPRLQDN